jgi:hypothetical protein
MKTQCNSCHGYGWVLDSNRKDGIHIASCKTCNQFSSDVAAVSYVSRIAMDAADKAVQ